MTLDELKVRCISLADCGDAQAAATLELFKRIDSFKELRLIDERRFGVIRQAVLDLNYFNPDHVGSDLAPRIGEYAMHCETEYAALTKKYEELQKKMKTDEEIIGWITQIGEKLWERMGKQANAQLTTERKYQRLLKALEPVMRFVHMIDNNTIGPIDDEDCISVVKANGSVRVRDLRQLAQVISDQAPKPPVPPPVATVATSAEGPMMAGGLDDGPDVQERIKKAVDGMLEGLGTRKLSDIANDLQETQAMMKMMTAEEIDAQYAAMKAKADEVAVNSSEHLGRHEKGAGV